MNNFIPARCCNIVVSANTAAAKMVLDRLDERGPKIAPSGADDESRLCAGRGRITEYISAYPAFEGLDP